MARMIDGLIKMQFRNPAGPVHIPGRGRQTRVVYHTASRSIEAGQENLPILLAALTKCTFWSEDISNALLEVIIFFLWAIDYHYV